MMTIYAWIVGALAAITPMVGAANAPTWTPPAIVIQLIPESPYMQPPVASITTHGSVMWTNQTATIHTVRADQCLHGVICPFDSGVIHPGETVIVKNLPAGVYPYHCEVHPIMRGFLSVEDRFW